MKAMRLYSVLARAIGICPCEPQKVWLASNSGCADGVAELSYQYVPLIHILRRMLATILGLVSLTVPVSAQVSTAESTERETFNPAGISLPADDDSYSDLVRRAQSADPTVDFRAMRVAYPQSKAFQKVDSSVTDLEQMRKTMRSAVQNEGAELARRAENVRDAARAILSVDYIDMEAHKLLRQACAILHDEPCATAHKFMEFGLLRSITNSGDGKSCRSAWEVVSIAEEHFILGMLGAMQRRQELVNDGTRFCDKIDVVEKDSVQRAYYFNVDIVLQSYAALPRRQREPKEPSREFR